ncbi:MAG: hypothetical protein EX285_01060 [Thaumarchaeota archaeon]|nr:hypothetical protein [Nitrososphaerota archaeon]
MSNEFPEWAEKEINSITNSSFIPQDDLEGTGYFLDIDKKNRKADIQFYEKLPIGKHIVTANIPKNIKIDELTKGFVYVYKLKILKASLSTKLSNYLKENLNVDMDYIYQFEVQSLEMLDVGGDLTSSSTEDGLED